MMNRHSLRAFVTARISRLLLAAVVGALLMHGGSGWPSLQAQDNPIVSENNQTGDVDWDISGAGDPTIQGFASDISINTGGTVAFKVKTEATGYNIDIYRLGYYGGAGARKVATVVPSATLPQPQPACISDAATGLADCGNWNVSASWTATGAVSGIYVAKLNRTDVGGSSHIVFVVRDDARAADVVVQTSDTTWQAYNQYPGLSAGGSSLYCGGPVSNAGTAYSCAGRAAKVSYNRPIDTRAHDPQSFVFNAEYPMVRWLEANGYNVKYISGVDTERRAADLVGANKPKIFMSSGHDEYWSGGQRASVEAARNAGVSLAFFSGNEMFWKTRFEPSIDGANQAYRTLVSYKETLAGAKIDPAVDGAGHPIWTGTWRDPRFSPPGDGGRPENGLIGQIWTVNSGTSAITVPASMANLRLWRNTRVAALTSGVATLSAESLGYEWDEELDNGARPTGLVHLSSTTVSGVEKIIDYGATVGIGTATHSLTLYRHNSGALVFGAGTVQWAWGLDSDHDLGTPAGHVPDQAMQQATVNLLADMGAQPGSLQAGADPNRPLVASAASSDMFAPTSIITSPVAGAQVENGNRVTITGTAAENGGGVVAGVEVSVDGGTTWRAASGTTTWSFDWSPGVLGSANIRSRAVDDSGNLESAGAGVTVSVIVGACPCPSLWKSTAVPTNPSAADSSPYELGVKFKSDIDGYITGVRFYKGAANSGTHLGNLWTSTGTLLATAQFTSETSSGWQQVSFSTPVAITANTTYVASYHTNVGGYAFDGAYFTNTGVDSPPLHALPSNTSGGNGVFTPGNSAFPTSTFNANNYWVDVVFAPSLSDSTPPAISNIKSTTIDSSRVTLTWSTDEQATSRIDYGTDPAIQTSSPANLPPGTLTISNGAFVTQHTVPLTGLQPNTTYYYLITAVDHSGNATTVAAPTFTVPGPTLRDTAASDFAAGTDAGTYVSQTADGEVILAPEAGAEFTGPALPTGWIEVPWGSEGYSVIAGGVLMVDGARVATCVTDANGVCLPETTDTTQSAVFTAPHSLEFSANFSGDQFQHAGLAVTFGSASEPWAIFSTLSGGMLFARTNTGNGSIDTGLGTGLLGAFHRYRIDWKPNSVDYYVDGALVVSHALTIAGPMRPVAASDFNPFGGIVFVDWMRLSSYATPGTFVSRVFDAASSVNWHSIQWQSSTPAGSSVAISVRTGDTPAPDATWSAFAPVAGPGSLNLTSQFIQYRAEMTSSDPAQTPALEDIIISTGHAPIAVNDAATVPENGSHTFPASGPGSLTANDSDADAGDTLRVVAVTPPSHGTASVNGSGVVTYTPTANYNGADSFAYTVSDGLLTASATVTLDVRFGNIAPVANNDFYTGNEDTTLTVAAGSGILANDTDVEHDPLTAVLVTLPAHGQLTLGANGGFSYTPTLNYAGPDAFTYKASDGTDQGNAATVQIQVLQVNDAPITEADGFTAMLNQPLDVPAPGVLRNDHDVEVEDTAPLHAALVATTTHGALTFRADGSFSYVPDADYLGLDSFTYTAVDHFNAVGNVTTVTLTVAIKAVSEVVLAGATVSTGGDVTAADPLKSAVTSPTNATVAIAQGVIAASQSPAGYTFLNQQVNISVTGADGAEVIAAAANPIRMVFTIDGSLIAAGQNHSTFQMFRNGVLIPNCAGATTIPAANLDPCVTAREAVSDDVRLTILTSHASHWNMGLSTDVLGDEPVAQNDGLYTVDFQVPFIMAAPGVLGNDYGKNSMTAALTVGSAVGGTVDLAPSGGFTFTPATGFCGVASFKYKAHAGAVESNEGTASMLIDCTPHAGDDATTVAEDSGSSVITVLSNDTDPDPGQTLGIIAVTQGTHGGVVAIAASGLAVSYAPQPNYFGSDSFTYTVSDGHNGSATANVAVTVLPVNDAPSFVAGGNRVLLEDAGAQSVAGWATGISAGPANESGQAVSFAVSNSNSALFSAQPAVAANGTLTFTPAPDANGSALVSVQLHDDGGVANGGVDVSAAQSFTITVTAVNDRPLTTPGSVTTDEDTVATGNLSASDVDHDALTYSVVANGAKGTATVTDIHTGAFSYAPSANANGSDSFTFKVNDGTVDSEIATVSVTINAVNDAPVANGGALTTNEDVAAAGTLAATDVENDGLVYSLVTTGSKGTATITNASTGAYSYVPHANANGADSFTFRVTDGTSLSNTATVTVTINPVNDTPVATTSSIGTNEDAPVNATLLASDVDGDALTYSIVASPAKGAVTITNAATGTFTYTPNLNANGSDSFMFKAGDGVVNSNIATVTVAVNAVNDAPTASNGSLTTAEDAAASGSLVAADVDGDAITYSIVTNGAKGTATITNASTGAFTYAPNANANGSDSFTFKVNDTTVNSNTATIAVTITPVNDAPTAANASLTTNEDTSATGTLSASDVDGDALNYSIVATGSKGVVVITNASTGAFTYTPNPNANGADSFTFRVADGSLNSNTATIGVTINPVNDTPVAANSSLSTVEDTAGGGTLPASDIDGDTLVYSIVANGSKGVALITNASTGAFTYTPNANATGSDSFTFRVSDGAANSNVATVSLTIVAVNDAPTFTKGANQTVPEDASAQTVAGWATAMSAGPADEASQALNFVVSNDNGGLFSVAPAIAANGTLTYTVAGNANGSATVTVRLHDDGGAANGGVDLSAAQTFTIAVTSINDAPSFVKGANQTIAEDAGAQSLAAWATSVSAGPGNEGSQALNFIVSNSNNALFSAQPAISASGTLTFTPAANANGSAIVTVQVHDNGGTANGGVDTSAAQTFTIDVTAANDAPSFVKGANQSATQDTGVHTVVGWATAISTGPADESGQAVNFIVSSSNPALFAVQPAVGANGTLTYTSAAAATGSATVTVAVHDNGGTANGGVDTSVAQTFTITITPKPAISIADLSVVEGNSGTTPANFAVTLSTTASVPVTVNYATGGGTARAPNDYAAASGTLTFAAGETSKSIVVQVVGETTKEKDETFGIVLSSPTNATIARSTATGIILDDDSTPRLSAAPAGSSSSSSTTTRTASSSLLSDATRSSSSDLSSDPLSAVTDPVSSVAAMTSVVADSVTTPLGPSSLVEGNTGKKTMTFAVWPSNANWLPMSVDYVTVAGNAARENVDFVASSGTLIFPAESTDPQFITVEVIGNLRHQPNHSVFVRLMNPVEVIADGVDIHTDIVDDDPVPTISVSDMTVGEAVDGAVNAVINVTLSNDSDDPVTVNYTTRDGAAIAGTDYLAQTGTLTFQPGVTSQPITVLVNPDTSYAEGLETFYVDLDVASLANAKAAKTTAVITITPPTAWVASTSADFASGTLGAGTYLSQTANGEVTLAPTVGSEFAGTALPTGWTTSVLATGGTGVIANGMATVDGASLLSPTTYGPGRTLEFVATFSGAPNQNAGFGLTSALIPPYAMFGVKADGKLYARSVAPGQALETPIAGAWFGTPHRFRIDYNATTVVYWVDGVQKISHSITYPAKSSLMRPAVSDLTLGDGAVQVDWMRMSPYTASGVYTSRVYDAGAPVTWQGATWLSDVAAGNTVTIEVRTGVGGPVSTVPTLTPPITWSAYRVITKPGELVGGIARFAQYRVTLATTVPNSAPAVKEVVLSYAK